MALVFNFVGGSGKSAHTIQGVEDTVNWVLVPKYNGGDPALVTSPGLKLWSNTGVSKEVRGLFEMNGVVYAVVGEQLIRVASDGTATRIMGDTILTQEGRVTGGTNGNQLVFADGQYGYCYDRTVSSLTRLSDSGHGFLGGLCVEYFNNRWLYAYPGSTRFDWSDLGTGLAYSGEFMTVGEPRGEVIRIVKNLGEVIVFKKNGYGFYDEAPTGDYVFRKRHGAEGEVGLRSRDGIASTDNTVYWMGDDLNVYRMNGYSPQVVSTPDLSTEIAGYSKNDDVSAFAYTSNGQSFVQFNFKTAGVSWLYSAATNVWTKLKSFKEHSVMDGVHRANCYLYYNGKHLVGDYKNGMIYEIDWNTYTDGGTRILRDRTTTCLDTRGELLDIAELELGIETGTALLSGQGSEPKIILQTSLDGGYTWGRELVESLGYTGSYNTRVIWKNLGSSRKWVFRVKFSEPIKSAITYAVIRPPEKHR